MRYPAAPARWGAPRHEIRRRHCRRIGAPIAVLCALPPSTVNRAAMTVRLVVLYGNGSRSWHARQRRARRHTAATAAIRTGTWPRPGSVQGGRSVWANARVLLTAVDGADSGRQRGQARSMPPPGGWPPLWGVALLPLLRRMLLQPRGEAGPQAGTKRTAVCTPTAPTTLQQASQLPSARRPTRRLPPRGARCRATAGGTWLHVRHIGVLW